MSTALPFGRPSCRESRPRRLLALDSDGTVMDSMEWKHRECFAPAFAEAFAPFRPSLAAECWNFVSLSSRMRGLNRYPALLESLRLLASHPEARGFDPGDLSDLEDWIAGEKRLSLPSLAERASATGSPLLSVVAAWSSDVNARIRSRPASLAFTSARAALGRLAEREDLDIVVISQTVTEDMRREWEANGIASIPRLLLGQEAGSKAEALARVLSAGYADALMVGDTYQDANAAASNGVSFFPIVPGAEADSWSAFERAALPAFLSGAYREGCEPSFRSLFGASLPEDPPWAYRDSAEKEVVIRHRVGAVAQALPL